RRVALIRHHRALTINLGAMPEDKRNRQRIILHRALHRKTPLSIADCGLKSEKQPRTGSIHILSIRNPQSAMESVYGRILMTSAEASGGEKVMLKAIPSGVV